MHFLIYLQCVPLRRMNECRPAKYSDRIRCAVCCGSRVAGLVPNVCMYACTSVCLSRNGVIYKYGQQTTTRAQPELRLNRRRRRRRRRGGGGGGGGGERVSEMFVVQCLTRHRTLLTQPVDSWFFCYHLLIAVWSLVWCSFCDEEFAE